jgi:nitrogen-specific signal transduction histidine kinase
VRKDGQNLVASVRFSPIRNEAGEVIGASSIVRDITEKKHAEERMRQLERMESLGRLAGGIAHDFNNILGIITGYTELALDLLEPEHKIADYLKSTLEATTRASDMVGQILAFSRRRDRRVDPIDINIVVREAMLNLCTNAAHAMSDGPGSMTVRIEMVTAADAARDSAKRVAEGDYARLSVQDTGHGMTPEVLRRVFEPFFTTKEQGAGIGMSVVREIVESAGGFIKAESQSGAGSTFKVYLPTSVGVAARPARPAAPLPTGAGERVLIVDDEKHLALIVAEMLRELNYQPDIFFDPMTALEAFRKASDLHAVVVNWTMPRLSGREFIELVHRERPGVRVILVTGNASALGAVESGECAVDAVLAKPVHRTDLAQAMRAVFGPTA